MLWKFLDYDNHKCLVELWFIVHLFIVCIIYIYIYIYKLPFFWFKGLHIYQVLLYQILGPNLVYQVVKRPDTMEETIQHMAKYILKNYRGQSGIIYCFSKKETETVSMDLYNASRGQIVCEVYHADLTLVCMFIYIYIYILIKKLNEWGDKKMGISS